MINIKLRDLFKAGVHVGHEVCHWNPKMFSYIEGQYHNNHIINLVKTLHFLNEASIFSHQSAKKGKTFLFIGTKKEASVLIARAALDCNSYYINYRWLSGTLSNWVTLKSRLLQFKKLKEQERNGIFNLLSKKEASLYNKELQTLRKYLKGIQNMEKLPDIAIIIDQNYEKIAVKECRSLGIPIISILDTNCDPNLIDIPIPGNDDGLDSIELILKVLSKSILRGKKNL
jgi:small subunit ribosomal protein S2